MFQQLCSALNAVSFMGAGLTTVIFGAFVAVGLVEEGGAVAPSLYPGMLITP